MRTSTRAHRTTRLLALGLAGVLALSACSSGFEPAGEAGDWADAEAPGAPEPGEGWDPEAPADDDRPLPPADLGDSTGPGDDADLSDENITQAGRSVITEGTVGIVVDDPQRVMQQITASVTRLGGWVEGMDYRAETETEGAHATIVVRVPSGEVGGALSGLSVHGTIMRSELSRVDVTAQVRDLDARIAAMEQSVRRMAEFLDQATSRAELLEAEQMFTDRQAQLEALLSQQRGIAGQVSMSTLTIELWTPESAPEPEPDPEPEATGFWAGLTRGWDAFYDFGSSALLVIGTLTPWLVFLGALLVLALAVRRPIGRWRARRAASRPPRPQAPLPPPATAPMPGPGQPPAGSPPQPPS